MTPPETETHRRVTATARSGGGSIGGDKAPSSIGFLLSQVGLYAARQFARRLAALDLHPPQFRVLNVVAAAEGLSQQAIGEAIQAPASRMVTIVDELEQRGLIERRPHPGDRRIRALYLTPEGRELLARARRIADQHQEEITRGMSAGDRKRLVELLQKIVDEQGIGPGVHPGLSDPDEKK